MIRLKILKNSFHTFFFFFFDSTEIFWTVVEGLGSSLPEVCCWFSYFMGWSSFVCWFCSYSSWIAVATCPWCCSFNNRSFSFSLWSWCRKICGKKKGLHCRKESECVVSTAFLASSMIVFCSQVVERSFVFQVVVL